MTIVVDFDSTIVSTETMEVLFQYALNNHPQHDEILQTIQQITAAGMEGKLGFSESLSQRINLLPLTPVVLNDAYSYLETCVSESFIEVLPELLQHNLKVVSGGFKEIIDPLLETYGIQTDSIYANNLIFEKEHFRGVNTNNLLAQNDGKIMVAQSLHGQKPIIVVGDGYTDYQIRKAGIADVFIYYQEFVSRPQVSQYADFTANNFNDVVDILHSLQTTTFDGD